VSEVVLAATSGGVATITLNRPKALNALDRDLTLGLRAAVFAAELDPAVRCVVIRGGEHFMAGGDLKWFDDLVRSRPPAENRIQFEGFVHEVHALIISLRRMPAQIAAAAVPPPAG
jgi:2-(1,2-epoxy-1,2-dihydrophenyl)acetyl-CoA isomerase